MTLVLAKTVQRVNENVRTTVLIELSLLICGAFGVTVSHLAADGHLQLVPVPVPVPVLL